MAGPTDTPSLHPMAPLLRFTLLALHLPLGLPLPAMAPPSRRPALLAGAPVGRPFYTFESADE